MAKHTGIIHSSEQWLADMDAWGLDSFERARYLRRLHDYHRRIERLHWSRYERLQRWELRLAVLLVVMLAVSLLLAVV